MSDPQKAPLAGEYISLEQYVDMRFDAQEKAVAAALAAAEKAVSAALAAADRAVTKAESASEKRFESMNEFRGALADSARLLMPRSEAEQSFRVLSDKIEELTKRVNSRQDQGVGLHQGWLMLVSVISIAAAIASAVFAFTRHA
jgi:hypothetical protein